MDNCEQPIVHTFPNLYPTESVYLGTTKRLLILENGRYYVVHARFPNSRRLTPSGKYDFVTDLNGQIWLARTHNYHDYSTHVGLSENQAVLFAGSITFKNAKKNRGQSNFNRGKIKSWNNHSGHYMPSSSYKHQAGLPIELFVGI